MKTNFSSLKQYALYLNKWLNDYLKQANKKAVVIGISGGIDSALALAICFLSKKVKVYPYFLDIENSTLDKQCIKALEKHYKIKIPKINLKDEYLKIVKKTKLKNSLAKSNIKPRLRMLSLYALAQEHNALVLGTSNLDELYLGYYTKYGDGACDLALLSKMIKQEVFNMAKELNVPPIIINRKPSASLYSGQTDEEDMGLKYLDIDKYLDGKKTSKKVADLIKQKHQLAKHKKIKLNEPDKAYINRKII
ncbi:MAG: NAD(+) synthase [Mycoplasma sp.]